MQEDSKITPKRGRIRRVHNATTLEITGKNLSDSALSNIRATTSRNRTTMVPGEIMQMQKWPKKRIDVGRQSVMPSQLPLDIQKKVDPKSKELELGLLYDEYLQTIMMDLIIKKKTDEKTNLMIMQLATITQEIDQDIKKLIKVKTRERDIISLSLAQKEIDAQLVTVTKCTKDETMNTVKEILSKLQSLLEPLDILRCNGVLLPETQNEWKETQEVLTMCSNTLKDITSLIGSKGETYCAVNDGLKSFTKTFNDLKDLQKRLEEALCNLQILVLKNATLSLTNNENQ